MAVGKNITLYAGDTYELRFFLKSQGQGVDLTGCIAESQIRASADTDSVLAEFDCEILDQTVSATKGGVSITLPASVTKTLQKGVYDFQLTWPDGIVTTYFGGSISVTPEVTRA